jgi:hypothetical protein
LVNCLPNQDFREIGSTIEEGKKEMSSTSASTSTYIPESETTIFYPASKRKKIVNHKGEVIYDSAKDQEKRR